MIQEQRERFNRTFTVDKYQGMIEDLYSSTNHTIPFRVSETPFFIPNILKNRLIDACNKISDVVNRPDFKSLTDASIFDPTLIVPGEDDHTTFLQYDFGITMDDNGDPHPMLIEVQGFPSVYYFQDFISQAYKKHYSIDESLTSFIDPNQNRDSYLDMMKDVIIGDTDPNQVVMLEIEPEKQATYIDFICTQRETGLKVLCISKVIKRSNKLYYTDHTGKEVRILKIYNRIIFDELHQRPDLHKGFEFTDDLDVEWIGHPNWFYRISKWTMPLFENIYVPQCLFLNKLSSIPEDLNNYVLKPLYSFAGTGVVIDVTPDHIDSISDSEKANFMLQKKVVYHPVIQSPTEPVKVEIRMLMVWPKDQSRPFIVNNLVRMSKGLMIGTKFNKDKDWVGGSVGFFES